MLTQNMVDAALERKLKNSKLNSLAYRNALRQFNIQISQDRLNFIKTRGSYEAFICNRNANLLDRKVNLIIQRVKDNQ